MKSYRCDFCNKEILASDLESKAKTIHTITIQILTRDWVDDYCWTGKWGDYYLSRHVCSECRSELVKKIKKIIKEYQKFKRIKK